MVARRTRQFLQLLWSVSAMMPDYYLGFAVLKFALTGVLFFSAVVAAAGLLGGFTGGRLACWNARTRKPILGALFSAGFSAAWTLIILNILSHGVTALYVSLLLPMGIPAVIVGALFGAWVTSRGNPGQN
jgi:hypothetical protein